MKIDPQRKLKDKALYNNLCLIVSVFCIICFITSMFFQNSVSRKQEYYTLQEGAIYGPIKITNKKQIYRVIATFAGNNSDVDLSGEVLDEDKDTIYEFGKDMWHEEGYDSDGYWSESDRKMVADLSFSEKGTYYIQFSGDDGSSLKADPTRVNMIPNVSLTMELMNGSYVAHLQVGSILLLIIIFIFWVLNKEWVNSKMSVLNEKLEEMSDEK